MTPDASDSKRSGEMSCKSGNRWRGQRAICVRGGFEALVWRSWQGWPMPAGRQVQDPQSVARGRRCAWARGAQATASSKIVRPLRAAMEGTPNLEIFGRRAAERTWFVSNGRITGVVTADVERVLTTGAVVSDDGYHPAWPDPHGRDQDSGRSRRSISPPSRGCPGPSTDLGFGDGPPSRRERRRGFDGRDHCVHTSLEEQLGDEPPPCPCLVSLPRQNRTRTDSQSYHGGRPARPTRSSAPNLDRAAEEFRPDRESTGDRAIAPRLEDKRLCVYRRAREPSGSSSSQRAMGRRHTIYPNGISTSLPGTVQLALSEDDFLCLTKRQQCAGRAMRSEYELRRSNPRELSAEAQGDQALVGPLSLPDRTINGTHRF
jgi:hypothetical protein